MSSVSNRPRPNDRAVHVQTIVDHIIETFHPNDRPIVLMWRETIVSYFGAHQLPTHGWSRDNAITHGHWKQVGKAVRWTLEERYHIQVVFVGDKIRRIAGHGKTPSLDQKRCKDLLTDIDRRLARPSRKGPDLSNPIYDAYRACLPLAGELVRGMVCFPPGTQLQDHPLLLQYLEQKGSVTQTHARHTVNAVDRSWKYGVISTAERAAIREKKILPIRGIIDDEGKYPLFGPNVGTTITDTTRSLESPPDRGTGY